MFIFNLKKYGVYYEFCIFYVVLFLFGLELFLGGCGGFCELEFDGLGGCFDVVGCFVEEEFVGCLVDGGVLEEEGVFFELEFDEFFVFFVEEDFIVLLDFGCGVEEVVFGKICIFGIL